jgi:hypothetical protein
MVGGKVRAARGHRGRVAASLGRGPLLPPLGMGVSLVVLHDPEGGSE